MATIKLKKSTKRSDPSRPPVRGGNRGAQPRPTLGQAQAQRIERDSRYNRDAQPQGGGGQGFGDRREQRPGGDRGQGAQRPAGDRALGGQRPGGDRPYGGQRPGGDRSYGGPRPGGERSYGAQGDRGTADDRGHGGTREQRPQGNPAFGGGRDSRPPSSNFERPQERPANRAFDSRSDRGATAHDNRPAPVAAGMGQKFDEKRFYEERNRTPRSVESQAPEQRYDEPRGYGGYGGYEQSRGQEQRGYEQRSHEPRGQEQRGYEQRGYEQRGYEQRGYDQRGYEQRPHEGRGHERRPFEGHGNDRPHDPRSEERRPYPPRSDDRGSYGQRSFEPRRDERPPADNRAFEQRPYQARGDERGRSYEPAPAQPRFADDRGRGQEFAGQRPAPRFENQREEPRRFEPQRFDERPVARPQFGPRDEAPRRDRGDFEHRGAPQEQHAPGAVRLSKRMSELGLASRREADEWIEKGWIRVDGKVVSRLGIRVLPEQQITIDPRAKHEQAARVTVLLNKPVGYVSGQAEDGYEPAVVLFTGENHWSDDPSGIAHDRLHLKYLAPAGRLDIESVGLLVLTQDGRVARQLIGEDSDVEKEYLVRVEYRGKDADFSDETSDADNEMPVDASAEDGEVGSADEADESDSTVHEPRSAVDHKSGDEDRNADDDDRMADSDRLAGPTARESLPEADLALLNHGLELDGEALIPARVEWLNDDQLRFVLREGKKRQIRRMCQAVGLHVTGLKRVRIGKVMLGDLPTGQWRYLATGESFV